MGTEADGNTPNGADPQTIGIRVRQERLRQGIGVRELARCIGVSASLISQVELGKATPSVGTLYAIVNQLDLSLDELLLSAPPANAEPVVRHRSGQTIQLAYGVEWERLLPSAPQDVDFLRVRYEVGSASCPGDALMRHSGIEYGYLIAGQLDVTVGFDTYVLGPGDSISFDSTTPHRLSNSGRTPAEAIWLVIGRGGNPNIVRS